jgi:hypothetical protein
MRWASTRAVWEIIEELICRWGIYLTNAGDSLASKNLYPDFTLPPTTEGDTALRRILAFIPDMLIFTGYQARLKDLKADEASSYSYGTNPGDHLILSGEYREEATLSRTRAIGRDAVENRIVENAFDWINLQLGIDILEQDYDANLQSASRAQERADSILRKHALESKGGQITIPTNVGQELYDVITVTDKRCGITSRKYRVMSIDSQFNRLQGSYQQSLTLGAP